MARASPGEPSDEGSLWRAARARVGRALNEKWHLDELLGVGGVAAVYAATHRNGRRVAIKLLHRECALDPESCSRFLREGYAANKVEHPGVVSVLDDDVSEDGSPFLVMELLDGETIHARWVRKGMMLQTGEVLSIADQLLEVLAQAHDRGVVHRDVKPANLFLTRTGTVKLLDFGLARSEPHSGARSITLAGAPAMGTPAFMPPEQALGRSDEVDRRTDLWAVGATILTLMSGRHVHEARNVNELLLAAMTRPAAPARSVLPGVTPDVARILDRALAFEKEERWPNARAMQVAVREAYQGWMSTTETLRMHTPRAAPTARSGWANLASDGVVGALRIALAAIIGMIVGSQIVGASNANARSAAEGGVRGRAEAARAAILTPRVEASPPEHPAPPPPPPTAHAPAPPDRL